MAIKKSRFDQNTVIGNDAFLDFFINGTNFKISKADFQAQLGATGTIVQAGPVTAVPVLDVQGSINAIRNLTAGPGITIELDAENGIVITNNTAIIGSEVIKEITTNTDQEVNDDYISGSAILNYQLLESSDAIKRVTIKSEIGGGNLTVIPFGGELIDGAAGSVVLTPDTAITIAPIAGGWSKS